MGLAFKHACSLSCMQHTPACITCMHSRPTQITGMVTSIVVLMFARTPTPFCHLRKEWRLFIFFSRESKWVTLKSAGNPRCAVPAESHSICTDRRRPDPAAGPQVPPPQIPVSQSPDSFLFGLGTPAELPESSLRSYLWLPRPDDQWSIPVTGSEGGGTVSAVDYEWSRQ